MLSFVKPLNQDDVLVISLYSLKDSLNVIVSSFDIILENGLPEVRFVKMLVASGWELVS